MGMIKSWLDKLVIEGSRHNKELNFLIRTTLYGGWPIGLLLIGSGVHTIFIKGRSDLIFLTVGITTMIISSSIVMYYFDKGYRQRDTITDEEYAALSHKPLSPSYILWSFVLVLTFILLNKSYLHWF
jgi:hypothetical protein